MSRYAIVTHEFAFEASHYLPGHRGQRQRPHGHAYRLQIALRGPIIQAQGMSDDGMVMDFEDLRHSVNMMFFTSVPYGETCGGLDHNDLNTLTGIRTTTENLVHWIWDALVAAGVPDHLLYRIRLWETEKECTEITHAERGEDKVTYKGFE